MSTNGGGDYYSGGDNAQALQGPIALQTCEIFKSAWSGVSDHVGLNLAIVWLSIVCHIIIFVIGKYIPGVGGILAFILAEILHAYLTIVFVQLYLKHSDGKEVSWRAIHAHVNTSLMIRLFWGNLVIGFIVGLGFLLIIPGFWLSTIWSLWAILSIDEDGLGQGDCCCGWNNFTKKSSDLVNRAGCCTVFLLYVVTFFAIIGFCITIFGVFVVGPWAIYVSVEAYLLLSGKKRSGATFGQPALQP